MMRNIQSKKILACYGIFSKSEKDDLEKGGRGSGRKKRGDYVIYHNPITNRMYEGRIHSTDSDGQYHHVRTTLGSLEYLENKHIKHADEKMRDKIHHKMTTRTYAGGATFNSDFE